MYNESILSNNDEENPKNLIVFIAIVIIFLLLLTIIVKLNNKIRANTNEKQIEHYQDSVLEPDTVTF